MAHRTGDMGKREAELVLGLVGSYDARKLRQAYARQAMRWHPDRQGEGPARERAEKQMIEVNLAYDRLKRLFADGTTTVMTEGAKWARMAAGVPNQGPSNRGATPGQGRARSGRATGASSQTNRTGTGQSATGPSGAGSSRATSAGATASGTAGGMSGYRSWTAPPPPPPPPPKPTHVPRSAPGSVSPPPPEPEPPAPPKPNIAHRIVERFPWRIAFLVVILLLFISPEHAGLDYIANFGRLHFVMLYQGGFLDFLLWQVVLVPLAIYNLFTGAITNTLLREPLLWLTERRSRPRP